MAVAAGRIDYVEGLFSSSSGLGVFTVIYVVNGTKMRMPFPVERGRPTVEAGKRARVFAQGLVDAARRAGNPLAEVKFEWLED